MTLSKKTQILQKYISNNEDLSKINFSDIKNIYQDIIDCIIDHNHLYYIDSAPIISDTEYDTLFSYLKKIEEYNPQLISSNSPTQGLVGQFEIQEGFNKAEHNTPLLSLENSYNAQDLIDREERIKKILEKSENKNIEKLTYQIEPKFDGISVELIYTDGQLTQAITRGDGVVGEDITLNTLTIKNLPHKINHTGSLHLRGEIMIPKSQLNKLNKIREENGENTFANTRNAASGSIKLLDTNIVANRGLVCYIYDILSSNTKKIEDNITKIDLTHSINLPIYHEKEDEYTKNTLQELGLPTFQLKNIPNKINSIQEIINICEDQNTKKYLNAQDLEFDGLVIKVQNNNLRSIIGQTAHHPRRAIAYKFPAEQVSTQIKSIEFQIGRTGIITPVANLEPVNLSGATISRVSLHNFDFIKDKDIYQNDFVRLQRSGEVIPYIVGVIKDRREEDAKAVVAPKTCPSCNSNLTHIDMHYYCENPDCPAQIIEKIIWFVSKNGLDIEGIGDSIIEILVEHKIINNFADLYKLLDFETERVVRNFPGFADKKISEIKNQLEESKNKEFRRLLNGLGIPGIGKKTAKDIFQELSKQKNTNDLNGISKYLTNSEFLIGIYGIGDKIIEAIINYRNTNQELLQKLEKIGLNFDCTAKNKQTKKIIETKGHFCITGSFDIPRPKIIEEMEKNGFIFDSNPNKNTNFMLIGSKPGSKLTKAEELGTEIIKGQENILIKFPFLSEIKTEQTKPQGPEQIGLF